VVDPPHGAGGAGGMEYPTFITAGTSWRLPPESKMLEEVTVHEFGHQFWMQLVATNEFEESPLDEGFNTYSTSLIMDKVYGGMGQLPLTAFGINLSNVFKLPRIGDLSMNRAGFLTSPAEDDLLRKSWQYYNSSSYGINSYMRMGVTLDTLERIVGHDTMARIMRTYHQRYRFQHPSAPDFVRVANEVSGKNLDWFFNQFFFGNRLLDYRIGSVTNEQRRTPMGRFEKGGGFRVTTRKDAEKLDDANDDNKSFRKEYLGTVKIQRHGDAVVPVEIVVRFKDGSVEKRQWDGEYRWVKYSFLRSSEIESVHIDPEKKYRLDVSFANNSWVRKYQVEMSTHWSANILFWLQNLMLCLTSVA
jgi:Peptidase family M1 domain